MKPQTPFRPGCVLALLLAAACSEHTPTNPAAPASEPAFSKQGATAPSGTLSLCKAGLEGVAAGDPFAFEIDLAGVARVAAVGAGDCLALDVPLVREPSSKGYYQRKTDDVVRLLPDGIGIVVDAAVLDAAQVATILRGGPGVEATSSLLLNLLQQLLAADLNVLRGAQPTPTVIAAMAEANAGLSIQTGPPIQVTTALAPSMLSALVNTLAAFNEGKLQLPAAPPTTALGIAEVLGALTELVSITCVPAGACSGIDTGAGTVSAATSSGQTTTVTFANRGRPVLRICKVAGAGVSNGTSYRFTAGGIDVVDAKSTAVAAGDCGDVELLVGTYQLNEVVPDGEAVQSIACDPVAACENSSPAVGQVHVEIVRGLTTVTFVNRSTRGTMRICKVAGTGISAGAMFHFSAGGINVSEAKSFDVAAGDCEEAELGEGDYMTSEAVPDGVAVSAIACEPAARCANPSLAVGTVTATVVGASTTTVTFTNRSILGTLRICKIAGAGVSAGAMFRFSAGGIDVNDAASYDVAAGSCDDELLEEGAYSVAEAVPAGVAVSGIACDPSSACSDPSLGVGAVTATVSGGALTTVSFTNRSTIATLRICKVAGSGVQNGVSFHFTAGGINIPSAASLDVLSGSCDEVELPEGPYMVSEAVPAGMVVAAIDCVPQVACSNPSLAVGTVTATLTGATLTTITFTNQAQTASAFLPRPGPLSDLWADSR